jgi:hypothetical protein
MRVNSPISFGGGYSILNPHGFIGGFERIATACGALDSSLAPQSRNNPDPARSQTVAIAASEIKKPALTSEYKAG